MLLIHFANHLLVAGYQKQVEYGFLFRTLFNFHLLFKLFMNAIFDLLKNQRKMFVGFLFIME